MDFLDGSVMENPPANAGDTGDMNLGQEYPLEEEMVTHIFAWKIHEQRSLVGYSPYGHKESDTIE